MFPGSKPILQTAGEAITKWTSYTPHKK
jgi:hypothetical protein